MTDRVDGYDIKFEKGSGHKKYKATVMKNGEIIKTVQFGDDRYQQYKDQTPLKLYKNKDHLDKDRRKSYIARHSGVKTKDGKYAYKKKFSASWFSMKYLW